MPPTTLDNVTIAIKAFEKPRSLNRTLKSIRRRYPDIRILVADDSARPLPIDDPLTEVHRLPYDVGLSAGRNHLLSLVTTPYVFVTDDDHRFTRETRLETLLALLESHGLDIVGGRLYYRRRIFFYLVRKYLDFQMNFEESGRTLRCVKVDMTTGADWVRCHVVSNLFLAKTDAVRSIDGWDPRLKLGEHIEFFLRAMRAGLTVACAPRVGSHHVHDLYERSTPPYHDARARALAFKRQWMQWYGYTEIVNQDGSVTTLDAP
jgi:hypothetical protein